MNRFNTLKSYVPKYYHEIRESCALLKAEHKEFERLFVNIDDVLDQYFVMSATWGLSYWERAFGLPADGRLTTGERRARLLARIRSVYPITLANFTEYLNSYTPQGGSTVREYPRENRVVAVMHAGGDLRLKEIGDALQDVLPAHLAWLIELRATGTITIAGSFKRYTHRLLFPGDVLTGTYPHIYAQGLVLRGLVGMRGAKGVSNIGYPLVARIMAGGVERDSVLGVKKRDTVGIMSRSRIFSAKYPISGNLYAGIHHNTDTGAIVRRKLRVNAQVSTHKVHYPFVNTIKVGECA